MSFLTTAFNTARSLLSRKTTGAVVALLISFVYFTKVFGKQIPSFKLSFFLQALSQNAVSEVFVTGSKLLFKLVGSETWYQTDAWLLTKDRLYKILSKKPNVIFSCTNADEDNNKKKLILNVALLGITYFVGYKLLTSVLEKDGSEKMLKKSYKSDTRFTDVYGLEDAKKELQEIVSFLKEPAKYKAVGARLRRGVLLHGPSGTGKTLLARAIAGESNAAFLSCAASEFVEIYVGVGPKRVRELFSKARQLAPCIIFIDEIDGIGTKRSSQFSSMQNNDSERTSTLNQLLTEMDGFRENHDIVIIAATNRPTLLDEALLRSGRFDTKIKIDKPSLDDRVGILKIHLRNKKNNITDEFLNKIGSETEGYTGADLENMTNEAAYVCVQKDRQIIENGDLQEAFEKIAHQLKLA